MNEKLLFAALTEPITQYLTALGITDFPILKANQTEPQGRVDRGAYVARVGTNPMGTQSQKTRQGSTTMQRMEQDRWQIQCYTPNDPANATQQTAGDLARIVQMVVQSPQYIASLHAQGIGIQWPTDILPLRFQNEGEQYEDYPTFDFTISYKSSIVLSEHEIDLIEPGIHRI